MKENALRESIKEDLVILGILSYQNIAGFRRLYGKDKDDLSLNEIVDGLQPVLLSGLRDLIKRSLYRHRTAPVAGQG